MSKHYADLLLSMPLGIYFKTNKVNALYTNIEIETPNYKVHNISLICLANNLDGTLVYETLTDCYGYKAPYLGIRCDEDLIKFIEENEL